MDNFLWIKAATNPQLQCLNFFTPMTHYFVLQSMIEGVDLFMGQDCMQTDHVILHMGNNTATIGKLMGNQITFFL